MEVVREKGGDETCLTRFWKKYAVLRVPASYGRGDLRTDMTVSDRVSIGFSSSLRQRNPPPPHLLFPEHFKVGQLWAREYEPDDIILKSYLVAY